MTAPRLRATLIALLIPAGLYAGLCLLLFFTQRSQVYFPVGESAVPGVASMSFESTGATLKIWMVERPGSSALIYFGGNAEDVGASIASFAERLPGHSLYFVNYRGYAGSSGEPSEAALVGDAIALYDRLQGRHAQISVLGRSLGSGVAVQLAYARTVDRLVLVTPFDSLASVAQSHYPWLPVRVLMLDRYESASCAPSIRAEALVVVAEADEVIPRARTDALIRAFKVRPRVLVLEGARHNDLDGDPAYLAEVVEFLAARPASASQTEAAAVPTMT